MEITERKVSIIDDYGDENWDALSDEIDRCLVKIAKRYGMEGNIRRFMKDRNASNLGEEYAWLKGRLKEMFHKYHRAQKKVSKKIKVNDLSGAEFENYIVKVLKENGCKDVRGTPPTGDQGADLIAKKNGKTIIIQTKRYKGAVGNKAIQEVIGAVNFYGGDEGWVITNSTFARSAKALAQKSNIKLIDGKTLANIKEFLKNP